MKLTKNELHQLHLLYNKEYSVKNKECIYLVNGESGLTHYGRIRAKVCGGGYRGCEGKASKHPSIDEPLCRNCFEERSKSE